MSLDQIRLDSLLSQLAMAIASNKWERIARLKIEIAYLRNKIEDEHVPVDPTEVYSPHTMVFEPEP